MHVLYELLEVLDSERIFYSLGRYRSGTVTVHLAVPGERIEFDVESHGSILVSRFIGNEGEILTLEEALNVIDLCKG
ncbi:hypothetical protein [Alcanivorax hongdengensis]|uniref:hypothetical protein n=1 Tax=Alcanivorax hongdengensis TaxID=519051 RepID=UPI000A03B6E3|nr:hypothetical protein [Alcanivorax hongdengensis]